MPDHCNKKPPRERTRSRSNAGVWTGKPRSRWARSRVGGTPAALTKPGLRPWGARKQRARGGASTPTRRHGRCPAAVPPRRALAAALRGRRGGRGAGPRSKARLSEYRAHGRTARPAAVGGRQGSLASCRGAIPAASRSLCSMTRPLPARTSRGSAVGGGGHGLGRAPSGARWRRGWSGPSGCRGQGGLRLSRAAATSMPKACRCARRPGGRWKHAENASRLCPNGTY